MPTLWSLQPGLSGALRLRLRLQDPDYREGVFQTGTPQRHQNFSDYHHRGQCSCGPGRAEPRRHRKNTVCSGLVGPCVLVVLAARSEAELGQNRVSGRDLPHRARHRSIA